MTTTYIAWTDANNKLNVQPGLTGLPLTLNQSSSHGPALAFTTIPSTSRGQEQMGNSM